MKKLLSVVLSLAMMLSLAMPVMAADEIVEINILHTNDTHGSGIEAASGSMMRYSQIKTLKDSLDNALLFDAGDVTAGTLYATMTDGLASINAMRMAGYDAMCFGNHEFTGIREKVVEMVIGAEGSTVDGEELKGEPIDLINSNIYDPSDETALDEQSAYQIYEVDGVKVGVFGIVTPLTSTVASPSELGDIEFEDPKAVAAAAVTALQAAGADYIVCLAHCGYEEADTVNTSNAIASVAGVDLVIDGHAHQSLMGTDAKGDADTLIVSTGTALAAVGKVTVKFNKTTGTLVSATSSAIAASTDIAEDAEIKAYLDGVVTDVKTATNEKIGYTSMGLYGGNYTNAGKTASIARRGETNVNSLIADARKLAAEEYMANQPAYKDLPVVALTCGGGVRATIPAGDITYASVLSLFLSGGTGGGTYVQIEEKLLWEIIEWGLSCLTEQDATTGAISANGGVHGRFPNFAGVSYTYDITKTGSHWVKDGEPLLSWGDEGATYVMGERVQSVKIGNKEISKDSTDKLVLVTSDYEMGGGDGYGMLARELAAGNVVEIGYGISSFEATANYIKALYAEDGDAYYPLQSGRVKNVAEVYTADKFTSTIVVADKEGVVLDEVKFDLYANYGTAEGVKWEKVGSFVTDENGSFTAELKNGPQELKVVAPDGTESDIKYVDNYAGLINSAHVIDYVKPPVGGVDTGDYSDVVAIAMLGTVALAAAVVLKKKRA